LLDLALLGRDVPVNSNDLLWIHSLGWVKVEPALSLTPPFYKLLGHCGPESRHGDDPMLIDVGRCFDTIAFEGRLTPRPDTGDRGVFDEEILQVLFELLLKAVPFKFLKPMTARERARANRRFSARNS
jgi:hypothetical protein